MKEENEVISNFINIRNLAYKPDEAGKNYLSLTKIVSSKKRDIGNEHNNFKTQIS